MRECNLAAALIAALSGCTTAAAQAGYGVRVDINTQASSPLPPGFSGFNTPQPRNGVEYYDPKFIAAVTPLKPGWVRFPGGSVSLAFDWQSGHINTDWMNYLIGGTTPLVGPGTAGILTASQQLTQAKGGVWLSDFAVFANSLGANAIVCVNTYTDTNPGSTASLATATQNYGLNVVEWELGNEAEIYPAIFPAAATYAADASSPYFNDLTSVVQNATVGLFSAGLFVGLPIDYTAWDNGLSSYAPRYWNATSVHVFPITTTMSASDTVKTLNGILAHGTVDFINSYLLPLIGANTPIFITELNCCTYTGNRFLTYLYNGVFLAEYIARMSAVPNVKGVGINSLYTDNYDGHGMIQSVNDYESYLLAGLASDPNFSTNTATDPNTQFQFYTSAPGLAMTVANQAINNSQQMWATTITGGSTVPILGYDGSPIPAVYGQAYEGNNGGHYLLLINKSGQLRNVVIFVNGARVTGTLTLNYVSSSSAIAANTAQSPTAVQIQTATSGNPLQIGPYSVTSVTW